MRILSMELSREEKALWDMYLAGAGCDATKNCRDCPLADDLETDEVLCKIAQSTEISDEIIVKEKRLEFKDGMDTSNLRVKGMPATRILALHQDRLDKKWVLLCMHEDGGIFTSVRKDDLHDYIITNEE